MRLTADGLTVTRGDRTLFRDLSFTVEPSEAVALIGANGAGKTTLLRVMMGLVKAQAGTVRFERDGVPIEPEDARARLHWLGWQDGLKTTRTARTEARFWATWSGGCAEAADAALEAVGLGGAADLDVRRLSAGQRRRLALSRLFAAPRALWLLDEPLAPLDMRWRCWMGERMAAHLAGGGSILAAVHDSLPVAAREVAL